MTKQEEDLVRAMQMLNKAPIQCEAATVLSVDEDELTCTVKLLNEDEINSVRLKAAIDNVKEGMVQIPEVGSTVIVGRIGNKSNTRFVILFSKVIKVQFYGGENGSLVIWENKLKNELDKVKDMLTQIVNVINGTPVPEPGNGAASALQASLKGAITGKQLPSFENLTDDKIVH